MIGIPELPDSLLDLVAYGNEDAAYGSAAVAEIARRRELCADTLAFALLHVGQVFVTKGELAEMAAGFTGLPVTNRFDAPGLTVGEHPRVLGDLLRVVLRNEGSELWGVITLKEAFVCQLAQLALDRRVDTLRLAVSFTRSGAAQARLREVVLENAPAVPSMARLTWG